MLDVTYQMARMAGKNGKRYLTKVPSKDSDAMAIDSVINFGGGPSARNADNECWHACFLIQCPRFGGTTRMRLLARAAATHVAASLQAS